MSEIAYSINSKAIAEHNCLVIDLIEINKEGGVYAFIPKTKSNKTSDWNRLAQHSADKLALQFLLKQELAFLKRTKGTSVTLDSLSIQSIHISLSQVNEAFTFLSATQKVFWQNKHLVVDVVGLATFFYKGHIDQSNCLEITAFLKWRDKEIALNDASVVIPGSSSWFLSGITLKKIQTSVSWKELTTTYPLLLEGHAKQEFLDALDLSDTDSAQLVMEQGELADITRDLAPLPVLKLMDRWGASANLWMNYGNDHVVPYSSHHISAPSSKTIKRNYVEEKNWEKDLLETDFIKKISANAEYYCPLDKTAKSLTFLLELGWTIFDHLGRQVIQQSHCNLHFDDFAQHIAITGSIHYDTFSANIKEVIGVFNKREHFVQLNSTTVGLLSFDSALPEIKNVAEEGEWVNETLQIKKSQFGLLDPLWKGATGAPTLLELKDKWQTFTGIEEALPSREFQGKLRPYQQQGVNWLAFLENYHFHGLLADEMGLGKTVQILAFLSRLPQDKPHLIVLPTSLIFNWRQEITKFLPNFKMTIHQGPNRTQNTQDLKDSTIILTSYTTLRIDLPLFQQIEYCTLILDEAQIIKNAHTQISQAVCCLHAQLRLSITGTPLENHMDDIWSHYHFLMPDLLGKLEQFQTSLSAAHSDHRHLDRIKRKIAPFFLRRCKKDVALDLPERIDQTVFVEMSEEQRLFYEKILAQFKGGLLKKVELEGMKKHRMQVFEAILRLRQACCHPLLLSSFSEEMPSTSAKFDMLIEDLHTLIEEGRKVIVYSQFTSMLKMLSQTAKSQRWHYSYLDGTTKNREEEVRKFQEDKCQSLFFISLKAGGVGLNLTAADYVYLYDPWWNNAAEEQAISRAHRIGREEPVITKRLIIAESIEERMLKLKEAKKLMMEELFDQETSSSHLTLEDLNYLLS